MTGGGYGWEASENSEPTGRPPEHRSSDGENELEPRDHLPANGVGILPEPAQDRC